MIELSCPYYNRHDDYAIESQYEIQKEKYIILCTGNSIVKNWISLSNRPVAQIDRNITPFNIS